LQSNARVIDPAVQDVTVEGVQSTELALQIPKHLNKPPVNLNNQLYI